MRIYLVRHGESMGNVDKTVHERCSDHAIPLSQTGIEQAFGAGCFLACDLKENIKGDKVRIWNSPYLRTRETRDNLIRGLRVALVNDLPFELDTREDIRLCEQQFGLFDGVPDEDLFQRFPAEYAHYQKCMDQGGRFWARMPLGESRFDVSVRVKNTFGTFHRDAEKKGIETIVVICHGVTLRAFVMEWLHLTPEWFDAEPNPGNCDIRLIDMGEKHHEDFGYIDRGSEKDYI